MGIRKLTALVKSHDVYQDELFGAGPLVIDGSGLVYQLYFTSDLDQTHGGEYGAFEDLLEEFFGALRVCDIAPYVVFDGCADFSGQKRETEKRRAEQRIQRAHDAAVTGRARGILPTLIWEVFRQTLDRLKVPLIRSYTEADPQAAALAHEWICPVLSTDSDFFIFPMNGGMLPSEHFRWRQVLQCGVRGYIPCRRYFSSRLCEVIQLRPQLLPALAVMAGNDYVTEPLWTGDMFSLLRWIRSLDVGGPLELMKAALAEKNKPQTEEELRSLQEAAAHYCLPPSPLSAFFCEGTTPPLPPQMVGVVPDWMRVPVSNAQFSSDFLDVVNFQRVGLSVVVDHKDKPSANEVSLPLRRVLYGLLLGPDTSLRVEERDRDGLNVIYTHVQPDAGVPFSIKTLEQETEDQRRQVLLDALGLNRQFLSSLPPRLSHLALPLAATCYWLMKATPPPDLSLLKALLIGWCKGDELRSEAAQDPDVRRPLDLDWCHQLNQWQSCFRDSFLLNQLLGGPLPQPTIARLYNGTLLHVLLHKITSGRLEHFFPPGTCSEEDYCALLTIVRTHTRRPLQEPSAPGGYSSNQPPAPFQPWGPFTPPLNRSQPWEPLTTPLNRSQPWEPLTTSLNRSQRWEPLTTPPPLNRSQPWETFTTPLNRSQPWEPFTPPLNRSQPWEPLTMPLNTSQPWEPLTTPLNRSQPWEPLRTPLNRSQPWEPLTTPQNRSQPWETFTTPLNRSQPWEPFTPPLNRSQPWEPFTTPLNTSQPWEPLTTPLNRSQPWEPFTPPLNRSQPWEPCTPSLNRSQPWEPCTPPLNRSQPWEPCMPSLNRSQPWEPCTPALNRSQMWEPCTPPLNRSQPWEPFTPRANSSQHWERFASPKNISQPWKHLALSPKGFPLREDSAQPVNRPQPWEPSAQPVTRPRPWKPSAQPAKRPRPWEASAQPVNRPQPWEPSAQPAKRPRPWEASAQPVNRPQPWEPSAQPAKRPRPWEASEQPAKRPRLWELSAQPAKRLRPRKPFAQPVKTPRPWEPSAQPVKRPRPWEPSAQPAKRPRLWEPSAQPVNRPQPWEPSAQPLK